MKSNKIHSSNISQTMTEVKNYVYLTLKKKPLIEKILDDVKEEAERRFNIFIQSKINLMPENIRFKLQQTLSKVVNMIWSPSNGLTGV